MSFVCWRSSWADLELWRCTRIDLELWRCSRACLKHWSAQEQIWSIEGDWGGTRSWEERRRCTLKSLDLVSVQL